MTISSIPEGMERLSDQNVTKEKLLLPAPLLDRNVELFFQTQERNCISLNELAWENNCTTGFLHQLEKDVSVRIEWFRSLCGGCAFSSSGSSFYYDNDRTVLEDFPWLAAANSKYVAEKAEFEEELGKVVLEWARNYSAKKKLQEDYSSYNIHESLERDEEKRPNITTTTTTTTTAMKQFGSGVAVEEEEKPMMMKQQHRRRKKRKRPKKRKNNNKLLKELQKYELVQILSSSESESESESELDDDSEPEIETQDSGIVRTDSNDSSINSRFTERPSDFEPSNLQPGEWGHPVLKTADPRTLGRQDDSVFDEKVFLMGMPDGFVESMLDFVKNEGLTEDVLEEHLGIHQVQQAVNQHKPLGETGWTVHRFDRTSDILNLFPSTGEKLREFLEQFAKAGLGQMLQQAGEELGFPKNDDGSFSFTLTEAAFIGVSYKDKAGKYHLDMDPAASDMLTLLVPLITPPAVNPELVFEGTDGARREYRYEDGVAVAFKSGVWHNTNQQLVQSDQWRFMATLHFGIYPKDLRQVRHMADALNKSFKMPPPRMKGLPRGYRVRQHPNKDVVPAGLVNWIKNMELTIHKSEDGKAVLKLPPDSPYCPVPKRDDMGMVADEATADLMLLDDETSDSPPQQLAPLTLPCEAKQAEEQSPDSCHSPGPKADAEMAASEATAEVMQVDEMLDSPPQVAPLLTLPSEVKQAEQQSPDSHHSLGPKADPEMVADEATADATDMVMQVDETAGSPLLAPSSETEHKGDPGVVARTAEDTAAVMQVDITPGSPLQVAPSTPPSETEHKGDPEMVAHEASAEDTGTVMQVDETAGSPRHVAPSSASPSETEHEGDPGDAQVEKPVVAAAKASNKRGHAKARKKTPSSSMRTPSSTRHKKSNRTVKTSQPTNTLLDAPHVVAREATAEDTATVMQVDVTAGSPLQVAASTPPSETEHKGDPGMVADEATAEDTSTVMQVDVTAGSPMQAAPLTPPETEHEGDTGIVAHEATVEDTGTVVQLEETPDSLPLVAPLTPPSETEHIEDEIGEERMEENIVLLPSAVQPWLPNGLEKGLDRQIPTDDQSGLTWDSASGS